MDIFGNFLHFAIMLEKRSARHTVPTYRLYGEGSDQSEGFWLHCETIPERSRLHDWEIRPHCHEAFFQFLYISNGSGDALRDGRWNAFAAGTLIYVPPGAVHGFRFSRDIQGLVVTIMRDRLDALGEFERTGAFFAPQLALLPAVSDAARHAVANLERIAVEMAGHGPSRTMLLEALVTTILIDLARALGSADAGAGNAGDRDGARAEQLLQLVAAHFREHRPVGFYAERLGLSPAHLNRVARAATGHSVQELVNTRLVEEARRDLIFTFLPAQSIAIKLGFSDPAYFSRFFRRHTGATPAAFRRNQRETMKL
ncbi:helix-turn-helix domain-containing protein [Mesorhizobium xinjiangense]|uniref:helix-turn-helix domain-containing protein n=1 Tax=Mesorhizobium xinjiangense TaxID=2678685 RepID=UPI001F2F1E19|nr:helix-turn-helix domain-containing protein [Mesorhizobium xinjiangense]